jgi:hypothetical protein
VCDDARVEKVAGRWWNGRWGRLARRDVRLVCASVWRVEALTGGAEGKSKVWEFANEAEARAMVNRLLETGGDGWRDLTPAPESERPAAHGQVGVETRGTGAVETQRVTGRDTGTGHAGGTTEPWR